MDAVQPVTPPVAAAPPPTAPPPAAAPEPKSSTETLRGLSPEQYSTWRRTGELPESQPAEPKAATPETKTPESSPGQPVEQAVETATLPTPASEPAPAKNAETRKAELQAEIDGLLKQRAALRAETERPAQPPTAPPASQPAAAAALVQPDSTDYEKYPLGSADPAYIGDMVKFQVATEKAAWQAEVTKARQIEEAKHAAAELTERVAAMKTKHPDFEDVTRAVKGIQPGSVADAFFLGSKRFGFDTLYHLGQPANRGELDRILAIPDAIDQFTELVLLGHALSTAAAPPAPQTTAAPPPPPKSPIGSAAVQDEAEAALNRGDFTEYRRIMNARDIASSGRLSGKR